MKNAIIPTFGALALLGCDKPAPQKPEAAPPPVPPPTIVSTIIDGRTIRATIAGSASIQSEGNAAVVTTDKHKFVVERERFTIDGVELLKLRPAVDYVEFYLNDEGFFTMNADLAGVAAKQLPSANPRKKQQGGGATRLDGRMVRYSIFGDGAISPEGDTAVITTEGPKIVVGRERVTLDGAEEVRVSPAAKDIRVTLTESGRFTVEADGSTLVSRQLSK